MVDFNFIKLFIDIIENIAAKQNKAYRVSFDKELCH